MINVVRIILRSAKIITAAPEIVAYKEIHLQRGSAEPPFERGNKQKH